MVIAHENERVELWGVDSGGTAARPLRDGINGFPGAAGVVEGLVRVITAIADGD